MATTAIESDHARAASADNVDVVRRVYRAIDDMFSDRPGALDRAFRDCLDEGFELLLPATYPEGARVLRGRDGMRRWVATTKEIWEEWRFERERFIPAGDQVVVLVRVVARGALSGVPLVRETAHLWTVEDGRVTRCEIHLDRAEGVEAAGRAAPPNRHGS
jgi:ketosteroid isomerase-like protein